MSYPVLVIGSVTLAAGLLYAFVLLAKVGIQDENGGSLNQDKPVQRTTSPYPRSYVMDRQRLRAVHNGDADGLQMMDRFQNLIDQLPDQQGQTSALLDPPEGRSWYDMRRRTRNRNRQWVEDSIKSLENRYGIADNTSNFKQKG